MHRALSVVIALGFGEIDRLHYLSTTQVILRSASRLPRLTSTREKTKNPAVLRRKASALKGLARPRGVLL